VTHLFVPTGPGVRKHAFYVRVSDRVIASLANLVDPPHLVLIGQVHTHKFEAFHSETDDASSLDTRGYLSVVIPRFAADPPELWREWAFHECVAPRQFRLLSNAEVGRRFRLDDREVEERHVVA
jgi:hypothetical protein